MWTMTKPTPISPVTAHDDLLPDRRAVERQRNMNAVEEDRSEASMASDL